MGVLKVNESGTWKDVNSPAGPTGAPGLQGPAGPVPPRYLKTCGGLNMPTWTTNTWILVPLSDLTIKKSSPSTGLDVTQMCSCFVSAGGFVEFGLRIQSVDYKVGVFYFNNVGAHFSFGAIARLAVPNTGTLTVQGVVLRGGANFSSDANDTYSYIIQETA